MTAHLFISQQRLNQRHLLVVWQVSVIGAFIHLPVLAKKLFPNCPRKPRTHQGTRFWSACSFSVIWHKPNVVFCIPLWKSCPWNSLHASRRRQAAKQLPKLVPPKGKVRRGEQCTYKTRGAEGKWVRAAGKYLLADLNTKESQAFLACAVDLLPQAI